MRRVKRSLCILLILCMLVGLMPAAAFAANDNMPFTDVKESDWFYESVKYVYDNQLMLGTGETTFSPGATITRGMIVTILHRMEGKPTATAAGFPDVAAGRYCTEAVLWASANGIVKGYENGNFGPDDAITREQLAAILYRYMQYKGYDVSADGAISGFADASEVSAYAVEALNWAVGAGVVKGTKDNKLAPKGNATRAEAATMLMRFCENVVPETYTVTFNYNYDGKTAVVSVLEGKTVEEPAAPERADFTFGGWYTDADGKTAYDFGKAVTENVTLYAKWTANEPVVTPEPSVEPTPEPSVEPTPEVPKSYTVSFDYNYDEKGTYKEATVEEGTAVGKPDDPSRSNYVFLGWTTDKLGLNSFDFSTPVTSDMTLYAQWKANSSSTTVPTVRRYTVTFELLFDGIVADPSPYSAQKVANGRCAKQPIDPEPVLGYFDGWYTSLEYTSKFDFSAPISEDTTIYAKWGIDSTDSDGDGLYDAVEEYLGTDINSADTDGDGLNDYAEVIIGTDPKLVDTDANGVSDYDEDADNDGLSNGYEVSIGTSPVAADSDFDLLNDFDEVNVYYTNPISNDTDGDGAKDGWEIANGFDPLVYNESFAVSVKPSETNELKTVTAGVDVALNGTAVESLEVCRVSSAKNPLVTPSVAGYLGEAYSFTVDGTFDKAQLVFRYDKSLGVLGDDFQPRIYYFNETEGTFEELENQIVEDGCVKAEVAHFSTYILLNKVVFDAIWETEIKPPLTSEEDGEEATLDIVFVIDYSASMDSNDPDQTFKELSKNFVSKLRQDKDQAAVVKFIRVADVVAALTTDKESLNSAIDGISYDSGYNTGRSGTDGSTGIRLALDELKKSDSKYQYIIFITDGEDNQYTYSYDNLIAEAVNDNVVIYTVGMGSANKTVLTKVATGTGGKYYHATTSSGSSDLIDLDKVFKEIESETIDLKTDTNNDGIPDYYNDLIFRGELVLSNGSNEFEGRDFNYDINGNLSDDFDGDGLKNGQELILVEKDGKVYLKMYSDPLMVNSDIDKLNDYEESVQKRDPLKAEFDGNSVGILTRTDTGEFRNMVELYESDTVFRYGQNIFSFILTDGFKDLAKKQIIDYFYYYSRDEYFNHQSAQNIAIQAVEVGNEYIGKLLGLIKNIKKGIGAYETISESEALEQIRKAADIIAEYKELGSLLYERATYDAEWYEQGLNEAMQDLIGLWYEKAIDDVLELSPTEEFFGNVFIKLNDFGDKYKNFMDKKVVSEISVQDTITLVGVGIDIAEEIATFAKINAATALLERNMDILVEIRDTANYSDVSNAAQIVLNAMGEGTSSYYEELGKAIFGITAKAIAKEVADTVLSENPVYAAYKIAKTVLKLVGVDKTVKTINSILCYNDMLNAVDRLCLDELKKVTGEEYYKAGYRYTPYYYEVSGSVENATRYLTHAAQIYMLAQDVYIDLVKDKDIIQHIKDDIESQKYFADNINLPLSVELLKEVGIAKTPGGGGFR